LHKSNNSVDENKSQETGWRKKKTISNNSLNLDNNNNDNNDNNNNNNDNMYMNADINSNIKTIQDDNIFKINTKFITDYDNIIPNTNRVFPRRTKKPNKGITSSENLKNLEKLFPETLNKKMSQHNISNGKTPSQR
jgi:hypothetical protein